MLDFNRFKVLTFDCYGTLINWEAGILAALRPVLSRHSIDVDDRTVLETYAEIETKQEKGNYIRYEVLLRLLMAEMSFRLGFDATLQELDCISASIKEWTPFPDTVEALEKLKGKFKLAVISNIDDRLFRRSAARLRVPLDWVVTAEQAKAYKPSPRTFEYAIERIGLPKTEILHVAQSLYHDIAPARALGLATVWVNRRQGQEGSGANPPSDATPDVEVASLKALAELAVP